VGEEGHLDAAPITQHRELHGADDRPVELVQRGGRLG